LIEKVTLFIWFVSNSPSCRITFYLFYTDHTTREYFKTTQGSRFLEEEVRIGETCLTYLSLNVFGYCDSEWALESLLCDNVFLCFAACHWGHHMCDEVEETHNDLLLDFLHDNSKVACASQVLFGY
jgi:hypothetical protein